uniref:Transmembrane protein n=1 Tax=Ascaris lumbricoides TaxID=6252 RepID=A0A0M3IMI0_ASCLU
MNGGNSSSSGPWNEDLSDTQGSCEELLKKVELKSQNSSPVATMETSRKGCGIEQQQMNGGHFVTAESNVHAIAERSITPDSDSLGLDDRLSLSARQPDKPTAPNNNNSGSQALPTGAEIFDIQSIQEVATHDETLNNVVLQKLGCFPTCFQFTLLRLSAMALLITAWAIMIFFPCVYLEYSEIYTTNISEWKSLKRMITETCPADPLWWVEETEFINSIISQSSYYKTLNSSNEQLQRRLYESERAESIRYPLNGQKFVISGCLLLAFPILISIMCFRCSFQGDDFMEEGMLDIVEIALFIVFSVVEGYLSSAVEIGLFWTEICHLYVADFDGDEHSERLEAQKFLLMAVSLHREMGLEGMDVSIQKELESTKVAMESFSGVLSRRKDSTPSSVGSKRPQGSDGSSL